MFNNFHLFGIKQKKIDWDKTVKIDFEGSINIEMYSNNLILDPRQSKNTLVCVICAYKKIFNLKNVPKQRVLYCFCTNRLVDSRGKCRMER